MTGLTLCRLFRLGRIPGKLRALLASEGIVVADEGITGCYIARDLKAPGKGYRFRREGFCGFLAITRKRIVAYSFKRRQINIASDDPKLPLLHARLAGPREIALSFESSAFHDDWHGVVELRFASDRARQFVDTLTALGASAGSAADA